MSSKKYSIFFSSASWRVWPSKSIGLDIHGPNRYFYAMNTVELLAPAKNADIGIVAVDCGADAVYIGADRFSAREAAGNSMRDIDALTRYAHKYRVNVYVALNTLLRDDELPEALQTIRRLYDIGIDGLIVQDIGLLECDLPPIPLIASTQMHNVTPERIRFLEQAGFRRVILARELSLGEIKTIRRQTTIELECFVHGALCVCYSGQCYLSYALGGRSGNRGQCAQPCRRRYSLIDESGKAVVSEKYLLSLKDMNRSASLRDLVRAGVTSFKIEGRLKDRAYVMNTVAHYRNALDAVLKETGLKRSSSGRSIFDFSPDPVKTFNRGYTGYFLSGGREPIASMHTPKSTGEPVGKVGMVGKDHFTLVPKNILHNGDGICFFDGRLELIGTRINRGHADAAFPQKMAGIRRGTLLFRNEDFEFTRKLAGSRTVRKIAVSMDLAETPTGFSLKLTDEDRNVAESNLDCEKRDARKPKSALATLRKQLAKLGGTEFECTATEIRLPRPHFIPVSELNHLRRTAVERLIAVREQNRPRAEGRVVVSDVPYPEKKLTYRGNVLNKKAEAFYRRHGVLEIESAAESGLDMRGRNVMTTKYCILYELGMCLKKRSGEYNPDGFFLQDEAGRKYNLHFNCENCEMEIKLIQ